MLLKDQIEIRDEDTQINIRTLVNTELHTDHLRLAANWSHDEPLTRILKAIQVTCRKPDNGAVTMGGAAFYKHAILRYCHRTSAWCCLRIRSWLETKILGPRLSRSGIDRTFQKIYDEP